MTPPPDIDTASLQEWLASYLPDLGGLTSVEKFAGGQSNPTYRISGRNAECVLRRKPFGILLPSAHAIEREYHLLSSLHPSGFPVPRPLALCEDISVLGSPFYLMEMVEGRNFTDGRLPGLTPDDRGRLYRSMIETLARLHALDPDTEELAGFGRHGNYVERQVSRWITQYRATQTDEIPEIERLIDWLPGTVPEQRRRSIIHGDYRLDNMIYHATGPTVLAVLDWELATIGDPLADFAYLLMNWIIPPMGQIGIATADLAMSGIPSLQEAIAIYGTASEISGMDDLRWYFAYNLFRLTGIAQGVKKRLLDGNAASSRAGESAARIPVFARLALEQARLAGA